MGREGLRIGVGSGWANVVEKERGAGLEEPAGYRSGQQLGIESLGRHVIGGQLAEQSICDAEGAAAVSGATIYEPCQDGGMAAIEVSAADKTIRVRWRGPGDAEGSPVIGGGAVWVTAYSDSGGGTLYELNPATGAVEHQIAVSDGLPHFSSMSLGGGTAYLGTLNGVTAVSGA